jgi:hypothetical protein
MTTPAFILLAIITTLVNWRIYVVASFFRERVWTAGLITWGVLMGSAVTWAVMQ